MAVNMNGEKTLIDYSIHKGSFQNFIAPNSFFKNLDYSSYSYFSCRRLGNVRNVRNTAGVNHSLCCAIAEILWSRSRLPGISKFQKIGKFPPCMFPMSLFPPLGEKLGSVFDQI